MTAPTTTDLVKWLREQIAETERDVRESPEWPQWNIAPSRMAARINAVLAQCEAHRQVLDFVEANSPGHIEVNTNDHDGDFLGAMFLALKMHDLLASIAIAYRHRPGYDDAIATLKTTRPEVRLSLSDEARGDELAARRYKTDRPDGGQA